MVRFAGPLFAFLLITALFAGCLTTTDRDPTRMPIKRSMKGSPRSNTPWET